MMPTELPNFDRTPENAARYVGFTDSYAVILASRRGHLPISYRHSDYVVDQRAREFFGITPASNHERELVFEINSAGIVIEANFGLYYISQYPNAAGYDRRTFQIPSLPA